jgi:adhesin transport system outer membrane protein
LVLMKIIDNVCWIVFFGLSLIVVLILVVGDTQMTVSTGKILGAGVGIAAGLFVATSAYADTIQDVVRQALATNPRMSAFLSNREAIDYELRRDRGLYLPQLDVDAGFGKERVRNLRTRGLGTDRGWLNRKDITVTLTQRLFDGFDAASRIGKQKARAASAAHRVNENAEVLALDAVDAYLEVYLQRELLKLAKLNVTTHVDILAKIDKRFKEGDTSKDNVSQASARRARSLATEFQKKNDLQDADAGYLRIVGEPSRDVALPKSPEKSLPKNWEAALHLAKTSNPGTKIFISDIEVARKDIDIAAVRLYPSVNFEASYSYSEDADGFNTWAEVANAMVRLRWNLYRGGSDIADRRAAIARMMQARNQRYDAANTAIEEMRLSWNAYETSKERVVVLKDAVTFNVDTVTIYKIQFETGNRSLLDRLDAENELFVTKGQLMTAEINVLKASFRMLAAGGRLLDVLNVQRPKQADPKVPSFGKHIFPRAIAPK